MAVHPRPLLLPTMWGVPPALLAAGTWWLRATAAEAAGPGAALSWTAHACNLWHTPKQSSQLTGPEGGKGRVAKVKRRLGRWYRAEAGQEAPLCKV